MNTNEDNILFHFILKS